MKVRYLTRQSRGITILQGPEETYIHEDGVSHGTGRQLDLGANCNEILEKAEGLRKEARVIVAQLQVQKRSDCPARTEYWSKTSSELKNTEASILEAQAALLVAENDLPIDPLDSFITCVDLKEALILAAKALNIASEWHVENVQVNPPEEWCLPANGEDPKEGWCGTHALAKKLNQIAEMQII